MQTNFSVQFLIQSAIAQFSVIDDDILKIRHEICKLNKLCSKGMSLDENQVIKLILIVKQ